MMNRSPYFNYIEEKLGVLGYRIELRGRLNILDLHIHSENFYLLFFNMLFGWQLENLNPTKQNVEAIDLIDHQNKIIIQVSATATKAKVESALLKKSLSNYSSYTFKFISISKDASNLRKQTYKNPSNVKFSPTSDIYDINSILNSILTREINEMKLIYNFIKKELGEEVDIVKLESNLATVINILSKENWGKTSFVMMVDSFEIERKIKHNHLDVARHTIDDYGVHYGTIDAIYSEFDSLGHSKSISVLNGIKTVYLRAKNNERSDDELFFQIIDKVQERVLDSSNYVSIPIDELELCVSILVVDAFIRCKIFENPENYNYVTT